MSDIIESESERKRRLLLGGGPPGDMQGSVPSIHRISAGGTKVRFDFRRRTTVPDDAPNDPLPFNDDIGF